MKTQTGQEKDNLGPEVKQEPPCPRPGEASNDPLLQPPLGLQSVDERSCRHSRGPCIAHGIMEKGVAPHHPDGVHKICCPELERHCLGCLCIRDWPCGQRLRPLKNVCQL
jgi:hypothetical protein